MKEIVKILMRRDHISEEEAWSLIEECQEEMADAIMRANYQECEDILASYLGLEPDYLDCFFYQEF